MPHTRPAGAPDQVIAGEKGCPAYASTDSACVDLFFGAVPDIPTEALHAKLAAAWVEDPVLALKLMFNLGNVRKGGGGKMDRENFYKAMVWLWGVAPETVVGNVRGIAEHTSLQCVLDVLMHVVHRAGDAGAGLGGYDVCAMAEKAAAHRARREAARGRGKCERRAAVRERRAALWEEYAREEATDVASLRVPRTTAEHPTAEGFAAHLREEAPRGMAQDPRVRTMWRSDEVAARYHAFCKRRDAARTQSAKTGRRAAQEATDRALHERCGGDGVPLTAVGRLREAVAELFAEGLAAEHAAATERSQRSLGGLYGKWAPTPGLKHDKATRVVGRICARLVAKGVLEVVPADASGERVKVVTRLGEMRDDAAAASCASDSDEGFVVVAPVSSAHVARPLPAAPQHLLEQCYRRDLLAKLRGAAAVPEHFVGRGEWGRVQYKRMASVCRMKFGKRVFQRHDRERYDAYVEAAAAALVAKEGRGAAKVSTGAVLPHKVANRALELHQAGRHSLGLGDADGDRERLEVNVQWHGIVNTVRGGLQAKVAAADGKYMPGWLPMCDVSGSMSGVPMDVAVALSLLMAEATPEDSVWHGRVMTFDSHPRFVEVQGIPRYGGGDVAADDTPAKRPKRDLRTLLREVGDLGQRAAALRGASWGMSTNIDAAFDLILDVARRNRLSAESVRDTTLYIFSDMEFDCAVRGSYQTMHERVVEKFKRAGYGDVPRVVYWNLRSSRSVPMHDTSKPGVALVSGFSASLLRAFLSNDAEAFTPWAQMLAVLKGKAYDRLRVVEGPQGGVTAGDEREATAPHDAA